MFKPSVLDKTASDLRREGKSSTNFLVKGHGAAAETKEHPFGGASRKLGGVFLSREQAKVRDMVVNGGKNVFFTGSAGERATSTCSESRVLTLASAAQERASLCCYARSSLSSDSSTTASPMPSP